MPQVQNVLITVKNAAKAKELFMRLGFKPSVEWKKKEVLSQEQIETLRKYMHSIGWDAEYQVTTQENQGQKYNQWYIEFFPCKRSLDILNAPEHMA